MQASLRSLRLRESDRAPANAGARLRLRAEVRRNRVAQAGLVVSVGIGTTRLRRPQSVTPPPATDCGPRSGTVPPRYGVSASPWSCAPLRRRSGIAPVPRTPLRRHSDLALGTTAFALAPRSGAASSVSGTTTFALELCPRSGAVSSARAFRPCSGVVPPFSGRAMRKTVCLVAGGQNRRFFAVSEVGNGRFCRLFAHGLPDSANNRAFWP